MSEWWEATLLDRLLRPVADLPRITGGSLDWAIGRSVRGGGTLSMDLGGMPDVDWLSARVSIHHHAGDTTRSMGVYSLAAPSRTWTGPLSSTELELLDGTDSLTHSPGSPISLPAGAVVTDVVDELIAAHSGWPSRKVTPSPSTLRTAVTYRADQSWLSIINDLLSLIGYGSLEADMQGVLTAEVYVPPERRPLVATYGPGDAAMLPDYTDEADLWSIPNAVHIVAQGTQDLPPIVGSVIDDDPASPWSIPRRGKTITLVEEAEVASTTEARALAARRLAESRQVTRRATITHPVDDTRPGDLVQHAPLDFAGAIVERRISLGLGPVVEDTIRRIYTGGDLWGL